MFSKTAIAAVIAFVTSVSATPIEGRTPSGADASCPKVDGLYFAAPPKNYLYRIQCNTNTSGGVEIWKKATDVRDCAKQCDALTSAGNLRCAVATFEPGKQDPKYNYNCALRTADSLQVDTSSSAKGYETVFVTSSKL